MASRKSSRVNPAYKKRYRVRNWPEYEAEGFVGSLLRLLDLDLQAPDHSTLSRRGQEVEVPQLTTQSNAGSNPPTWTQRDEALRVIAELGRLGWQRESGYRKQSRVEITFFRFKSTLVGFDPGT